MTDALPDDELRALAEVLSCSQCGQTFTHRACGPSHALLAADITQHRLIAPLLAHVEARTAKAVEAALTEAADALEGTLGTTPAPPRNLWEFRCWLRDRAAQVRAARGATEGRGEA